MIFEFELDPIENVQPWGESPNERIHWFGLTQGIYRLKVGNEYLLNYTDEFTDYISKNHPQIYYKGTYVDYYVVRIWEDLIDLLPTILEPVPKDLQHFFKSDYKVQKTWFEKVNEWEEKAESQKTQTNDEISNICDAAIYWIQNRQLECWYLSPPAKIWFWADENDVIISWDNADTIVEGFQVWSAKRGNFRINRDEFIAELKQFDKKLFAEMEKRVDIICKTWNNNKVSINFEQLKGEQIQRATLMENHLNFNTKTDWRTVSESIDLINS
jgi:Family of unknown function (DUF5984)